MENRKDVRTGEIIQIVDVNHAWLGALLIIDEVRTWGVIAYVVVPKSNDGSEPPVLMFNRLEWDTFDKVGSATILQS